MKLWRSQRWWLFIPIAIFSILAAIWIGQQIIFQIQYGGMPIAAMTTGFAPDCLWSDTAVAWIDANANGVYDQDEQALSGVTFHVDDALNGYSDVGQGYFITNSKGETKLAVWLPGCPNASFEVYPDSPSGFQLTTEPRLSADVRDFGKTLEFGFDYMAGMPTATPPLQLSHCTSHQITVANRGDISDLAIATDGSVWVTTFGNGVFHYLSDQNQWVNYKAADGLINDRVYSITVLRDGALWFATEAGASHWDGAAWVSYTMDDGLIDNTVFQVAQAVDGSLWFATLGGASHLKNGSWTNYTSQHGLADDFVSHVAVAPDESIWLTSVTDGVSRLFLSASGDDPRWLIYSRHTTNDAQIPFDFVNDIEVAPDRAIWFGGFDGLMRLDPQTETWKVYDEESTNGAFSDGVEAFTFGPDGTIWIASSAYLPTIYHFDEAQAGQAAWQIYDSRDGLPQITDVAVNDDNVEAIAVSSDNVVWIATLEYATRCQFQN